MRVEDAAANAGISVTPGSWSAMVDTDSLHVSTTPERNDKDFVPAIARPGTYEVAVWKEGYEVWRQSGVAVTRDQCDVARVPVRAALTRLS